MAQPGTAPVSKTGFLKGYPGSNPGLGVFNNKLEILFCRGIEHSKMVLVLPARRRTAGSYLGFWR